jgi:hypothetical protein
MKKILSILLALTLVMGLSATALAADITTAGGSGSSPLNLSQEATTFSVTVPTSLPVSMDASGNITTATTAYIYNNSYGPVVVTNVRVATANGWSLAAYTTDFKAQKVGLKQFGLTLNGDAAATDGSVSMTAASWPSIPGWDALRLSYTANVAAQSAALTNVTIAGVVFTVAWDASASDGYVLASDTDFSGSSDGGFYYIGTAEYVEVPAVIKGVTLTSLDYMFDSNTTVKGVMLPDSDEITSMEGTFGYSTIEEVGAIPENVEDMSCAFEGCEYLTAAPALPDGVLYLSGTFADCINLVTGPTIPAGVLYLDSTFLDCASLTGLIRIDANPYDYTDCFYNAATNDGTSLTVTGSTSYYNAILRTGSASSHIYPVV